MQMYVKIEICVCCITKYQEMGRKNRARGAKDQVASGGAATGSADPVTSFLRSAELLKVTLMKTQLAMQLTIMDPSDKQRELARSSIQDILDVCERFKPQ